MNILNRWVSAWVPIGILMVMACSTTERPIRVSGSYQSMLREADQYFDQGQYHSALLKYSGYVLSPYPDKKNVAYARHRLVLCYFFLGQYSDAYEVAKNLLTEYPNYEYKNDVNEVVRQCETKLNEEKRKGDEQVKALQQKVQQYEQFVAQNPQNAQYHFELGNLYWSAAMFSQAVGEYEKAAKLDPNLLQQDALRNRIRINDTGKFMVRDPLLDLGQGEEVRVVNAHLERVERSNWLGQTEVLRLSGFVENKGLKDVQNVRIEATIYDFFDKIQDTKLAAIGSLPAGGKRAFSVVFDQYSGLGVDIKKSTTQVLYDK